jgi:hypothetical protein
MVPSKKVLSSHSQFLLQPSLKRKPNPRNTMGDNRLHLAIKQADAANVSELLNSETTDYAGTPNNLEQIPWDTLCSLHPTDPIKYEPIVTVFGHWLHTQFDRAHALIREENPDLQKMNSILRQLKLHDALNLENTRNLLLHDAITHGHLAVVELLWEWRIHFRNQKGRTPLYTATVAKSVPIIKFLLKKDPRLLEQPSLMGIKPNKKEVRPMDLAFYYKYMGDSTIYDVLMSYHPSYIPSYEAPFTPPPDLIFRHKDRVIRAEDGSTKSTSTSINTSDSDRTASSIRSVSSTEGAHYDL